MRVQSKGSVVFRKMSASWHFLWYEDGHRRSRRLGSLRELPSREAAEKRAKPYRRMLERDEHPAPEVQTLIEQYRAERMPLRHGTRLGYEACFRNHILPAWGNKPITEVQPRPVELWLKSLPLAPGTRYHLKSLLRNLWDYAMWKGAVATERNPMELVIVRGMSTHRTPKRSLTPEEFQRLLAALEGDNMLHTLATVCVCFGLRISEALGLKWADLDWLQRMLKLQRGVVKGVEDEVKTVASAKAMPVSDEALEAFTRWRQHTDFSDPEDWVFASPVMLGRKPISYRHVWLGLRDASRRAEIHHISSHVFRHTYRTWLDAVGTTVGVQQKMMRHANVGTTMNIYGDAATADMREASAKVGRMAVSRQQISTDFKAS